MIFNVGDSIGKYKVQKFLGAGNFGETYLVFDSMLNKNTVIKLFFDGEIKKLAQEAQIQTQLRHSHIVNINAADVIQNVSVSAQGIVDILQKFPNLQKIQHLEQARNKNQPASLNVLYIDMEHMSGGSLGKKMQSNFLSNRAAVNHMVKVLAALEYIHSQNYIHKDVKPDNILLDDIGIPKLADFGLSDHLASVTQGGYTTHIPPECFLGAPHTVSSDIFAAGMTLFRLANNYNNWMQVLSRKSITMIDLQKGKLIEKISFYEFVPDKLKTIIKKACHKDIKKRYQTISEFKNALARICPSISWQQIGNNTWEGVEGKNVQKVTVTYSVKKQEYSLIIKKRDRVQNNLTKIFSLESDATAAMYEFIRGTYQ